MSFPDSPERPLTCPCAKSASETRERVELLALQQGALRVSLHAHTVWCIRDGRQEEEEAAPTSRARG